MNLIQIFYMFINFFYANHFYMVDINEFLTASFHFELQIEREDKG